MHGCYREGSVVQAEEVMGTAGEPLRYSPPVPSMIMANRRQMTEEHLLDYAWVDDWLLRRPGPNRWPAMEWKRYFLKLSKKLSYILRHGAAELDLTLREDGYIRIGVLLVHRQFYKFGFTEEEVVAVVKNNAKKRFALTREGNTMLVRAQQGHSGRVGNIDQHALNIVLGVADVPEMVVHGTKRRKVRSILADGLKTMGRDHIHMARGLPTDVEVISGCRSESDAFLKINATQAIEDNIEFLCSGNGVLLTAGVGGLLSAKYIECVMDRYGNVKEVVNAPQTRAVSHWESWENWENWQSWENWETWEIWGSWKNWESSWESSRETPQRQRQSAPAASWTASTPAIAPPLPFDSGIRCGHQYPRRQMKSQVCVRQQCSRRWLSRVFNEHCCSNCRKDDGHSAKCEGRRDLSGL